MKRFRNRILGILLVLVAAFTPAVQTVYADTIGASLTPSAAAGVGDTVTFTVSISGAESATSGSTSVLSDGVPVWKKRNSHLP